MGQDDHAGEEHQQDNHRQHPPPFVLPKEAEKLVQAAAETKSGESATAFAVTEKDLKEAGNSLADKTPAKKAEALDESRRRIIDAIDRRYTAPARAPQTPA